MTNMCWKFHIVALQKIKTFWFFSCSLKHWKANDLINVKKIKDEVKMCLERFCLFPVMDRLRRRGVRQPRAPRLLLPRPTTAAFITWTSTRVQRPRRASVDPGFLTMDRSSHTRKSSWVRCRPEIGRVMFRDFTRVD